MGANLKIVINTVETNATNVTMYAIIDEAHEKSRWRKVNACRLNVNRCKRAEKED